MDGVEFNSKVSRGLKSKSEFRSTALAGPEKRKSGEICWLIIVAMVREGLKDWISI